MSELNPNTRDAALRFAARVKAQVERLADSPLLSRAKLPLQMLRYVVSETLSGRADDLKEYTVGAFGLGLGAEFNPVPKNTVRQIASQLRAKLRQYYGSQNSDDLVVIELPPGGYVPTFREIETSARRSSSRRAVELFEVSRRIWQQDRSPDGVQRSITCLEQALQIDPAYANAHAALAEALVFKVISGDSPALAMPRAADAIARSLAIDDLNADAHAIHGAVLCFYHWRWTDADTAFRRAIHLNSETLVVRAWYANYLVATCRLAEAIVEAEAIMDLAPGILVAAAHAGKVLYMARRFDDAIERLKSVLEIDPHFDPAIWPLGLSYVSKRQYQDAVNLMERHAYHQNASPESLPVLGIALALQGDATRAAAIATELEQRSQHEYFSAGLIGMVHVALGSLDRAFDFFSKAVDERSIFAAWLNAWPPLEPLRNDERFVDLRRRIGL